MLVDILLIVFLILYFSNLIYKLFKNRNKEFTCSCSKTKNINKMLNQVRKELNN
jgi:hypothetical protein